jgi:hypothetical protein
MTVKIDFIPGMPPDFSSTEGNGDQASTRTNQVLKDSMPIVHITPGIPEFAPGGGIDMFYRKNDFDHYHSLLKSHGFELSSATHGTRLSLAYLADSFPTDSFTNEYGENFFQSMTNIASEGAASLAQVLGVKSVSGIGEKIPGILEKGIGGNVGKALGGAARTAHEGMSNMIAPLMGGRGMQVVDKLMAGGRIDFPMLWKNSAYTPSYTMTIRLYNPNPSSDEATEKYILGPIAAIMLLGVPISEDATTYSWPFIHSFHSPGIYKIDPAFISNITVIKGGDQQQIAFNQKLALVDVRIDIGSLFNSMMVAKGGSTRRPTVQTYVDNLREKKTVKPISTVQSQAAAVSDLDVLESGASIPTNKDATGIDEGGQKSITDRVNDGIKSVADSIINQIPGGFRIGN